MSNLWSVVLLVASAVCVITADQYYRNDDIEIIINKSIWKCDMIFCPRGTANCRVFVGNTRSNPNVRIRENICYAGNQQILQQKVIRLPSTPYENQIVTVNANRRFISSASQMSSIRFNAKELNEFNRELQRDFDAMNDDFERTFRDMHRNTFHDFPFR